MKKLISGKVREVYDAGDGSLLIVTTDRISAFDVILPTPIPGKGAALNGISNHWFSLTQDIVPNHIISTAPTEMPSDYAGTLEDFQSRSVLVKKLKMLPYEFIIRGFMFGSMWKSYKSDHTFAGAYFPGEYKQAQRLAQPMVTPSTKAAEGHDINVTLDTVRADLGADLTDRIERICLDLYARCYDYALERGIIIADTKLEFGLDENGQIVLADEVFTPDSSRFWDAKTYEIGASPLSYDKQFVRDWLIAKKLDGVEPPPDLPAEIAAKTGELYADCYRILVG